MKTSKINQETYLNLYKNKKTDLEISLILNIPYRTISNYRKNIIKLPLVEDTIELSQKEIEILAGTLLGDSSILYVHSQSRTPHVTFCHTIKQKEYFMYKYNSLVNIMSCYFERNYQKESFIKGKQLSSPTVFYAVGKCLKCLEDIYNIFRSVKKKIIPIDFLNVYFTERSLAFLFMDDGCKNLETINISMQSFSIEELENFVNFLKRKFDLNFNIKKSKDLYLRYDSRIKFYNLVKEYITEDTKYKIDHLGRL